MSVATFQTPAGWAERCTFADPALPHQIKFLKAGWPLIATCNCGMWRRPLDSLEQAWRDYRAHEEAAVDDRKKTDENGKDKPEVIDRGQTGGPNWPRGMGASGFSRKGGDEAREEDRKNRPPDPD